jgi:hypothetical protein
MSEMKPRSGGVWVRHPNGDLTKKGGEPVAAVAPPAPPPAPPADAQDNDEEKKED